MKHSIFLFVVALMAMVGSADYSADPTLRKKYYQENVVSLMSGVYEHDGDLYVHVQRNLSGIASLTRTRMKAIAEANDLLRRWVIGWAQAHQIVDGNVTLSIGERLALGVLGRANPQWRYADWKYVSHGQEFTGNKSNKFWLCQVMRKDDIVRQIPDDFRAETPSTNAIYRALVNLLPQMLAADSSRLYVDAGAVDLVSQSDLAADVSFEGEKVSRLFVAYKSSSPLCAVLRRASSALTQGQSSVSWNEQAGGEDSKVSSVETTTTNTLARVSVTTNILDRVETSEECERFGVSRERRMREVTRIADTEEIVLTRTVTTITTTKTIRRKTQKEIFGFPHFEEIFLSGGTASNAISRQVASGAAAAKLYGCAEATLEAREKATHDALCENPGDVQMWNMYGRCLLKKGDGMGALICFRAAAKLDRTNKYVLTNLAEAYENLGCHRIACGYAILGYGLSNDDWCQRKCRAILEK